VSAIAKRALVFGACVVVSVGQVGECAIALVQFVAVGFAVKRVPAML